MLPRPAASPEAGSSVVITSLDSAFVRNSLFLNKCFVSIKTEVEGSLATCARLNFTDVHVAGAAAASVLRQRPPRWKRFWTQILWFRSRELLMECYFCREALNFMCFSLNSGVLIGTDAFRAKAIISLLLELDVQQPATPGS